MTAHALTQPEDQPTVTPAVQVKICGLTNLEDAQAAVDAGANLLGFIFYERSPRFVTIATVVDIVAKLRAPSPLRPAAQSPNHPITVSPPRLVGVFVNPPLEQVVRTMNACGLDLAQLHGEEPPDMLAALRKRVYKALRPRSELEAASQAELFAGYGPLRGPELLVDAYHPAARGGTGQTGDWMLAARLARRHRLLLAGGLTPANVAAAIAQVHPWGVDVASGVEAAPGRKDHAALRAFVAAATKVGLPDPL